MRDLRTSLPRLFLFAFYVTLFWIMWALFNTSEFVSFTIATGSTTDWREVLTYQLSASMVWATYTPFVVFIVERIPVQKPYALRNVLTLALLAPVLTVIRGAVGGAIFRLGEQQPVTLDFVLMSVEIRFHRDLFLMTVVMILTQVVLAQRRAAAREQNELALEAAVANSEIEQLRSATQPRFMFAMLDSVVHQIRWNPAAADRMLVGLGDLLRQSMSDTRTEMTLADELELIDRYFELAKTRSDERFTTRVELNEELLGARVPPLVLHPLIESAIIAAPESAERHIEIRGREERGHLLLEIVDSGTGAPDDAAVSETTARIHRTFDGLGWVRPQRSERGVVTQLAMPLEIPIGAAT